MLNKHTASDKLRAYAAIETEQSHHAREAADAIFKPKRQTALVEHANSETGATAPPPQQPVRTPRILTVQQLEPEFAPAPKASAEPQAATSKQHVLEIPRSE